MKSLICVFLVLLAGCASHLTVSTGFDQNKKLIPLAGIPLRRTATVEVTTTTKYKVSPEHKECEFVCDVDDVSTGVEFWPIGAEYFASFKPAPFGKSEFKLELNDSGALKSISLNSDPQVPQNIEAVSKLLSAAMPALMPAAPAAAAGLAPANVPGGAAGSVKCGVVGQTMQQKKDLYCIKASQIKKFAGLIPSPAAGVPGDAPDAKAPR